jgi:hypothetical protein
LSRQGCFSTKYVRLFQYNYSVREDIAVGGGGGGGWERESEEEERKGERETKKKKKEGGRARGGSTPVRAPSST